MSYIPGAFTRAVKDLNNNQRLQGELDRQLGNHIDKIPQGTNIKESTECLQEVLTLYFNHLNDPNIEKMLKNMAFILMTKITTLNYIAIQASGEMEEYINDIGEKSLQAILTNAVNHSSFKESKDNITALSEKLPEVKYFAKQVLLEIYGERPNSFQGFIKNPSQYKELGDLDAGQHELLENARTVFVEYEEIHGETMETLKSSL